MCDKHTKSILNLYFKDAFFFLATATCNVLDSPGFIHHTAESLCPSTRITDHSLLPCLSIGEYWSTLCSYVFDSFLFYFFFCNWQASEVVYSSFCAWLISLSPISSKFIASGRISFSVKAEKHSIVHAHNDSFIDSSTNKYFLPP